MNSTRRPPSKADIFDVAKVAGVSTSTVSRSFNHPHLLKASTKKRIDDAVKKLGYIRNRAAQAMHGKRSGTIGLIVPTIDHAIFAEVIQSFSDGIDEGGFALLLAPHNYDLDREYELLRKLLEHRVDGVTLIGLEHSQETYQLIAEQRIPAVALWNFSTTSQISCVGAENRAAGAMAAEHLLDLGHRDIALVFPETKGNDRARDRLNGAINTLRAAGVNVPDHWRISSRYSISHAKRVTIELLNMASPPSALLCGNDVIAQGAIYAAQNVGLGVPDDLSIIGIGDFKGSGELEPALSTVRIPAQRIGQVAAELIQRMIAEESEEIFRTKFGLECLHRETTREFR